MRHRAAVIILHEGRILLLRRFKYGRRYYLVPGGGVEEGETVEEAAVREAREETGLAVCLEQNLCRFSNRGQMEHYFVCRQFSGNLCLGGPEAERQSQHNIYELTWVPLSELDHIPLRPPGLVEKIYSLFSAST